LDTGSNDIQSVFLGDIVRKFEIKFKLTSPFQEIWEKKPHVISRDNADYFEVNMPQQYLIRENICIIIL
jgi:hypothetical protein